MTNTEQKEVAEAENKRKVEYGLLAVADKMPDRPQGQGRPSPLMAHVAEVMGKPELQGKAVNIALYESKTAAGAAANVLRQRFGRNVQSKGVEFATRKHTVKNSDTGEVEDRHGLWMIHDPGRIVEGAWEGHVAAEQKRLSDLAHKKDLNKLTEDPSSIPGGPKAPPAPAGEKAAGPPVTKGGAKPQAGPPKG